MRGGALKGRFYRIQGIQPPDLHTELWDGNERQLPERVELLFLLSLGLQAFKFGSFGIGLRVSGSGI